MHSTKGGTVMVSLFHHLYHICTFLSMQKCKICTFIIFEKRKFDCINFP